MRTLHDANAGTFGEDDEFNPPYVERGEGAGPKFKESKNAIERYEERGDARQCEYGPCLIHPVDAKQLSHGDFTT